MILGICLALASAGPLAVPVFVPTTSFTLAWTHSIEKVRWEEDYAVELPTAISQRPILKALKARVQGSAAGMEPPPDAVLRDGWFEYATPTWSPQGLRLTRSEFTADYEWCEKGQCVPMAQWLPSDGNITLLTPCMQPRSETDENRGSCGATDKPRVGPWAREVVPQETGLSCVAADAPSAAQAPSAQPSQ